MSFDPSTAFPAEPFDPNSAAPDSAPPLQMVLRSAVRQNPDQAAEAARLAKVYPMAEDVLARNLQDVKFREVVDKADEKLRTAPILASRMRSNPFLANQTHDHVDNLSALEKSFDRTVLGTVGDVGVTALKGAVGLPQSIVGLADIVTGGYAGKGVQALGVDFKRTQNILGDLYSPAQQAANKRVEEVDGFFNTLGAMVSNPSTIATTVGESLPQMLGGAAIARGLLGVGAKVLAPTAAGPSLPGLLVRQFGEKYAPVIAAAIGEGTIGAGAAAENYRANDSQGLLTAKTTLASLGAGVGTAVFSLAGGAAARRMGLEDIDTALAAKGLDQATTRELRAGFTASILKSGISEGVFEEMPQSIQEQMWQNWANDKPLTQGVGKAAAQGVLAGFSMGGGFQAITRVQERMNATADAAQDAQRLQDQFTLASSALLRERNPDEFRTLVQSMANQTEGAPTEVYVDAEVLNQLAPEVLAQLPGVAEQMQAALAANSVVSIPMGDVLTVAPGTPLEQMLVEHARIGDVTAMSQFEAREAGAKAQEFLAQESQRVIQQAVDQQAMQESSDRVKQGVLDQLNTVGRFRKDVNEGYATWTAAFYTTMAGRMGTTPEQMAQQYPLRITGQTGQGGVLNAADQTFLAYAKQFEDSAPQGERAEDFNWSERELSLEEVTALAGGKQAAQDWVDSGRLDPAQSDLSRPVVVAYDDNGQLVVWDGVHRLASAALRGEPVRVVLGNNGNFNAADPNSLNQDAEIEAALDDESDDAKEITQDEVPESVDAGATLASTLALSKSKIWQKGRDLKIAMQEGLQALARAAGVDVSAPSPQTTEYLTRVGVKDALFALEQNANAVGWYDLKTRQALAIMALVHKEIATDETAQLAFVWAMAVTSNGLKVGKNFEIAEKVYTEYKRTGKMPTDAGIGTAGNAINKSLGQFNELLEKWGPDNLRKFMLSDFTVSEITGIDKALKPGGEHADVVVKGAAILGPKIGNGFFSNLFGNFDSLTMDRWLIRTWGRWSATLIKDMPKQTAAARTRLGSVIDRIVASEEETKRLSALVNTPINAETNVDALASAVQEASMDPQTRAAMNETDIGLEMRKAGNSLAKYLDGQKEAPSGPTERKYIREVFGNILAELRKNGAYSDLTMADLQAVLWYAEKRLYESAKQDLTEDDDVDGYSDDDAPDYANAAADVARAAGVSDRKISNAMKKEEERGRTGNARPADASSGQSGAAEQAAPGGFTRTQKREFIAREAIHRIRSNRVGDDQQPWSYAGRSGSNGPRSRLLKALGVSYVAEWKLGAKAASVFKANGLKYPKFLELTAGEPNNAQRFADLISASKAASPLTGAAVYVYPVEDYAGMRLFVSEDGKSGVAVKPDGDIVSVFGGGGTGHAVMEPAVAAGGTKLDAFQTILPEFYSVHGFVPAARLTWDDSQAPDGWDKTAFSKFNNGEPDVVFMVLDPQFFGRYDPKAGARFEGDDAYGKALDRQKRAGNKVKRGQPLAQDELNQGPRGTFSPKNLELALNENADLSTFLHETGHFFLEVMADLAAQPGAPTDIQQDMAELMKWFGVADLATWNNFTLDQKRPYHERFAESFEQYLLEGKAPSVELQPLFRKFRAWMVDVYKNLKKAFSTNTVLDGFKAQNKDSPIQLSPEIRQVFDRMLASEEQIAEAEQVAGLLPDYEATNEAVEMLTARSMRDLKWSVGAFGKAVKALQKQAAELRKGIEAEVRAEVEQQPIYRAMQWLRKGEMTDEAGNLVKAEKGFRLATEVLGEMFPETMLARPDLARLKGMTVKGGLHPDLVADMFGFESGDALVRSLIDAEPLASVIEGITDQRMLEQHGDLIDQRAIEAAANEAVHNEARARSLATELRSQAEMLNPRTDTGNVSKSGSKITVNAIVEAAKQFAADVVARTPLRDLKAKAWQHTAAERRAGKRWQEATAKGETQGAVKAKQDQVLNNAAAKAALDAQTEMRKILTFFKRVIKDNNEKVVDKGRDPDVVNAARAVLAAYGVAPKAGKTALEYLALVEKNDPAMFAALQPSVQGALNMAQPLDALTMEELRGLFEEIQAMWHLAKRSRQMEVDGNLMDIQDAEDELQARMQAIGVPLTMPGESSAITPREKAGRALQFAGSLLRRAEQWAEGMGLEFTKLVFQPVKDAANAYRADRVKYRKAYQALVDKVAPALVKGEIAAPELGYTFGKGHNGIGHAELLHAILHTGNASNKRKLLLGRGWATENADGTLDTGKWDAFLTRMHDTGILNKAHYDFAQGVWDLLEQTKPLAQKTHRDVFGRYFAEVTADSFDTPFGSYAGGYVPAQADPRIVQDAALRDLATSENENMAFSFPGTNKGFTKGRVEYNRPLMLDLRTIGQHIDKVLLFSHMEPAVRDVNKLLSRKGVSYSLGRIDPTIYAGMLTPWLNRSARQIVETPIVGDGGISRVLSAARSRAGMALMFANVSNAIQQTTGFLTAMSKLKSDGLESQMTRATAQFIKAPKKTAQAVSDASPFMAARMENEIAAINDAMDQILLDPNLYERAQAWTQKHAYFLQTALANTMEPIIWTAGYNAALDKGLAENEAVRYADGLIRQTQGSTLPEDVSRLETGPAYARIFTQFIGYFNMMANTNATGLKQVAAEMGLKKGAGKALGIVTLGMLAPLWMAEAIAQAMRGGPDDEDKDGYLDDWLMAVFGMGTIKGTLAMIPFVGQLGNAAINRFNGNPADDKMSLSPAVSLLEAAVGVPVDVYKAITDPDKLNRRNAVRDVASAISIATGLPAVAIARPLGYLAGVGQGRIDPTSGGDMARGLVTGTPSPDSK